MEIYSLIHFSISKVRYSHIMKLEETLYPYPGTEQMEKKHLKREKIVMWTNVHELAINESFTPSRRESFYYSFSKEQWGASPWLGGTGEA